MLISSSLKKIEHYDLNSSGEHTLIILSRCKFINKISLGKQTLNIILKSTGEWKSYVLEVAFFFIYSQIVHNCSLSILVHAKPIHIHCAHFHLSQPVGKNICNAYGCILCALVIAHSNHAQFIEIICEYKKCL